MGKGYGAVIFVSSHQHDLTAFEIETGAQMF